MVLEELEILGNKYGSGFAATHLHIKTRFTATPNMIERSIMSTTKEVTAIALANKRIPLEQLTAQRNMLDVMIKEASAKQGD